jgi:uncharacterized protein with beta-barrel porin domain
VADLFKKKQRKVKCCNSPPTNWHGGSQTTDGNAVAGTNGATSRIFGMAAGADYRFSPTTIAGFALAGGGTSFGVNGFGSGRSDLFQAGAFVKRTVDAGYVSAAARPMAGRTSTPTAQ